MTDETTEPEVPLGTTPSDGMDAHADAGDIVRARKELTGLAEHWAEREDAYDTKSAGSAISEEGSPFKDATRRFSHNKVAVASLLVLLLMVGMSIFAPMVSNGNTEVGREHYANANKPISAEHWFGTDPKGRDMWKRAWLGGRISLAIGFATAVVILLIGMVYGAVSGYVGGRLDNLMMRFLDALYGLPYIPFAIISVTILRSKFDGLPPVAYMVPALALTTWFTSARIMRSQILSLKENEYVESARASGAHGGRVLRKHIVPNTLGIMVVAIALEVPNAILGEATLSFLGLGVQIPHTSWGLLAFEGYTYFSVYPHLVWVPGLLIATTVLASVSVADGLRDALDPRGKRN